MTKRQERNINMAGNDMEKIEKLSGFYLKDMQTRGVTLSEAKITVRRMACILEVSEIYRPETPLSEVSIRQV